MPTPVWWKESKERESQKNSVERLVSLEEKSYLRVFVV